MKPSVRDALFACVSTLALAALMPALAHAQSTDVGGPGKALTTGTITSANGTVTDGGAGNGVATNSALALDTVTVNNATIASQTGTGLSLSAVGLTATLNGVNRISGTTGISFTPTVVSSGSSLSIIDPGSSIIGTNGAGITLSAIQGAVSLNVAGSVTGTTAGILATSFLGGFNITATGVVTGQQGIVVSDSFVRSDGIVINASNVVGTNGTGISATNSSANIAIVATNVTGAGSGAGIAAVSNAGSFGAGSVSVTSSGTVKGGTGGGIIAQSSDLFRAGGVSVAANVVQAAGGFGIQASGGSGAAAVSVNSVFSAGGAGISASGSTVTINAGTVTGGGSGAGIMASATGSSGAASLAVTTTGAVKGGTGGGIVTQATGSAITGNNITITSGTVDASAGGSGIGATTTGGTITITTGAVTQTGGTVFTNSTDLKTVTAAYDIGIAALSYNGAISVTANGAVTADGPAILAADTNGGAGAVSITANGPVTSLSGPAIYAQSGTGGVALNLNGNVTGLNGPAITTISGSNAIINLAGVQVAGKITTANTGVINIATAAGQTSTLTIGSGAVVGLLAGSTFNTAIRATGGVVKLINNGTIQGGIDFSGVVGASSSFSNTGTLSLQNGKVGDSINLAGIAFTGSGASTLVLDTNVGAGPSGTQSDLLIVGSSAGRTNLVINDTNTAPSGFNPGGIALVVGATHAGDFVLDPRSTYYNAALFGGALDTPGFFFSQLGLAANGNTVLFSAPRVQAYQLATLPAQVETLWYAATAQADRQGLLRDRLHGAAGEGADAPGLWLKLDGTTADRDVDQRVAANGTIFAYDAGYSQDTLGVSVGYDRARPAAGGQGGMAYGVSAGYADARAKFDQMGTRIGLSGWSLGGYASYVAPSGLYASGAVGGEWLRANVRAPQVAGFTNQHPDVTTLGLSGETGLRMPLGAGMALEPSVGAAYMHASIDSFTSAGVTFRYDDPESLRLSIGARLTGETGWALGAGHTRYEASLRAVDDVMASNRATLVNSGVDLVALDSFGKTFGEAKLGLTTEYRGGWRLTGALRARWSDRYTDEGLTASARWRF